MATAITTCHAQGNAEPREENAPETGFLRDLADDIRNTPDQMRGKTHSTLFNKHLLMLANLYLALIVLLLGCMMPFLYLVNLFL